MKVQNGQQYNRLTIVKANSSRKNGRLYSLCKCTCGTVKEVLNQNLIGQHTFSCGCWNRERASERMKNKRPYSTKTRLYGIWKNIRRRTRNDKVQEIAHKYLKIIYVDETVKMALFDISKTLNVKMGCFWYNGGT